MEISLRGGRNGELTGPDIVCAVISNVRATRGKSKMGGFHPAAGVITARPRPWAIELYYTEIFLISD